MHADPLSLRQILIAGLDVYTDNDLPENALRENLLLDMDTSTLKSGMVLRIGTDVLLWLTFQCEACGHLNRHKSGLSKEIGAHRGMLARVFHGGEIKVGDSVHHLDLVLPKWSDDWRDRVTKVLDLVQPRMVIEYKQLARLAGVPSSYCRVFPKMTKELGPTYVRKAVSMHSQPSKKRWLGSDLFKVELSKPPIKSSLRFLSQYNANGHTPVNTPSKIYEDIKQKVTTSLNDTTRSGEVLEVGSLRVFLSNGRSLKSTHTTKVEPKPYPEIAGSLPNDYDSWLS
jgi:hypothetical protein